MLQINLVFYKYFISLFRGLVRISHGKILSLYRQLIIIIRSLSEHFLFRKRLMYFYYYSFWNHLIFYTSTCCSSFGLYDIVNYQILSDTNKTKNIVMNYDIFFEPEKLNIGMIFYSPTSPEMVEEGRRDQKGWVRP